MLSTPSVPEVSHLPDDTGKFDAVKSAIWKAGEPVPYLALAKTFEKIGQIKSRLKIVEYLTEFFRSVIVLTPQDLLPSLYLCVNRVNLKSIISSLT